MTNRPDRSPSAASTGLSRRGLLRAAAAAAGLGIAGAAAGCSSSVASGLTASRDTGTLDYWKAKGGLAIDIQPSRSAAGRVESIERRDVQGMSFAFQALEDDWHLERGEPVREVIDMLVSEVSPVTFPAYPGTDIRVVSSGRRGVWDHDLSRARLAR